MHPLSRTLTRTDPTGFLEQTSLCLADVSTCITLYDDDDDDDEKAPKKEKKKKKKDARESEREKAGNPLE